MSKKKEKNKRKSELKVIFFIILVSAALFILSTYAWFSTQKDVSITNLTGTVEVAEGLEVSLNANKWANELVLGKEEGQYNITDSSTEYGPYEGHRNISPTEMLPVSTLGLDKNSKNLKMLRGKLTNSIILSDIKAMVETETDSEKDTYPGYFAFDLFLKNSSKTDENDVLQLNYNSSLQILETDKIDSGLQNTVRVAFARYGGVKGEAGTVTGISDVNAGQSTILKETGAITGGDDVNITDVAIWEPNSNDHVDYIVNNNNSITWPTDGEYGTKDETTGIYKFSTTTKIPTYGLAESSIGATIDDIYKWDGNDSRLKKQMTLQTTKTSTEDYKINEGVQDLISTSSTDSGTIKFSIPANCVVRLRIYVWLEGQDVDCINYASHGGGIKLNIGLVKGSEIGSKAPAVQ